MQVELRLMRYVVAVAEEGGFQAAARRLRIGEFSQHHQAAEIPA